jgi:Family of unknown function (DUF6064)
MNTPFTVDQFLEVFRNYNETVFPMQVLFYLASILVLFLAIKPNSKSDRIISGVLAFLWLWMGIVYHLIFFTAINKAAFVFGSAFIGQGILFIILGILKCKLSFRFRPDSYGITGLILILFALVIYPMIGYILDHRYPWSPTFGLPCPTTIFTFGLLLLMDKKFPVVILIIPFIWSIIGFTAAFHFGIVEDIGLLVSGLLSFSMLILRNRNLTKATVRVP